MMNKPPWGLCLIFTSIIIAGIFIAFPQVDIFVSSLFYSKDGRFFLSEQPLAMFVHGSVTYLTILTATALVFMLAVSIFKKRKVCGLNKLRLAYLLLALMVGPGLVVNALFKENWGRARPSQVTDFGGVKKFTPAFIITNQCETNCSFVSGDPSVGFYFFAFALAIPQRRRLFNILALSLGTMFGATRIIQGAHFFSDVVFSGIFTFTSIYLLYIILLKIEARDYSSLK